MKRMKKMLALGLAVVMTLGMTLTAWAEPAGEADAGADKKVGTSDDRGFIEISGVEEPKKDNAGVMAVAYPIIQASYDNGIFAGYTKLYRELENDDWKSITTSEAGLITGDSDGNGTFDAEVVTKVLTGTNGHETVDALTAAVLGENPEGILSNGAPVTKEGIVLKQVIGADSEGNSVITGFYSDDVVVGTYLVIIKNSEKNNYTPVVVSSYYTNAAGTGNDFSNGTLNIAKGTAWTKVTEAPGIKDKEVTQVIRPDDTPLKDAVGENVTGSANIGDVLTYQIEVASIPYYGGEHPLFQLTDRLSEGLKYTDNEVTIIVKDGDKTVATLERGEDYVITEVAADGAEPSVVDNIAGKTEMVINFVVTGSAAAYENGYTLNDYQGKNMIIEYRATVQNNAGLNQDANTNTASLDYSKNSHLDGDDSNGNDPGKTTKTYTFDIGGSVNGGKGLLQKVDAETEQPLGGAEFTIYTDADCTKEYTNNVLPEGKTTSYKIGDTIGNETLEENDERIGTFMLKGLAEGTYYLKETKAPDGYSLNEHAYRIDIVAEYFEDTDTALGDNKPGDLKNWKVFVDEEEHTKAPLASFAISNSWADDGNVELYPINNTKLINLPSTGGIGTTVFTIAGILLMVGAAFLFFANRRKAQSTQEK